LVLALGHVGYTLAGRHGLRERLDRRGRRQIGSWFLEFIQLPAPSLPGTGSARRSSPHRLAFYRDSTFKGRTAG
jgi:hypothetical protein